MRDRNLLGTSSGEKHHQLKPETRAEFYRRRALVRFPNGPKFWEYVPKGLPDDACWPWTGPRPRTGRFGGYGMASYKGRTRSAQRVMWMRVKGDIPAGMDVCHRCDNRACVNPNHLFLATHAENMQDAFKKRRLYWQRPEAVRFGGPIVLDEAKVADILLLTMEGSSARELADRYGVTPIAIYAIVSGKTWKHVPRPEGFKRPPRVLNSPARREAMSRMLNALHTCECGRVVKGNAIGSHRKACRRLTAQFSRLEVNQ